MTLHSLAVLMVAWLPRRRHPEVRLDVDGLPRWEKTTVEQRWLREEDRRTTDLHLRISRPF